MFERINSCFLELKLLLVATNAVYVYIDRCSSTQFHCSRGRSCFAAAQECDGLINCNDASDEANCCKLLLLGSFVDECSNKKFSCLQGSGASILGGGEQSPTFFKVRVEGLRISTNLLRLD